MKTIVAFIKSLFTNQPQSYRHDAWYFVRGKKKSAYQLIIDLMERPKL